MRMQIQIQMQAKKVRRSCEEMAQSREMKKAKTGCQLFIFFLFFCLRRSMTLYGCRSYIMGPSSSRSEVVIQSGHNHFGNLAPIPFLPTSTAVFPLFSTLFESWYISFLESQTEIKSLRASAQVAFKSQSFCL